MHYFTCINSTQYTALVSRGMASVMQVTRNNMKTKERIFTQVSFIQTEKKNTSALQFLKYYI